MQGYDWVGWNNDSMSSVITQSTSGTPVSPTVEMIFRFDAMRNFSVVRLHCNNMFTRDVRVFRSALPAVSRDGSTFTPVEQYVTPALLVETPGGGRSSLTSSESVRNVTVPMHGAIGRFVRLRLEFSARWMLISEVEFSSGNINIRSVYCVRLCKLWRTYRVLYKSFYIIFMPCSDTYSACRIDCDYNFRIHHSRDNRIFNFMLNFTFTVPL